MRPLGIWPFDNIVAQQQPAQPVCWSDALNDQLISDCQARGTACTPDNIARLLSLEYCSGTCERTSDKTMLWALGLGVAAIAFVAWKRSQ